MSQRGKKFNLDQTLSNSLLVAETREFIFKQEERLVGFVADVTVTNFQLESMTSGQRLLVHKIAERFLVDSPSSGDGADRYTLLIKTERSRPPRQLLRDIWKSYTESKSNSKKAALTKNKASLMHTVNRPVVVEISSLKPKPPRPINQDKNGLTTIVSTEPLLTSNQEEDWSFQNFNMSDANIEPTGTDDIEGIGCLKLKKEWAVWFSLSNKSKDDSGNSSNFFEESELLTTINNIESFWGTFNNLPSPRSLNISSTIYVMLNNILPREQSTLSLECYWLLFVTAEDAEILWIDILCRCVGNNLDIAGLSLQRVDNELLSISIWEHTKCETTGNFLQELYQVQPTYVDYYDENVINDQKRLLLQRMIDEDELVTTLNEVTTRLDRMTDMRNMLYVKHTGNGYVSFKEIEKEKLKKEKQQEMLLKLAQKKEEEKKEKEKREEEEKNELFKIEKEKAERIEKERLERERIEKEKERIERDRIEKARKEREEREKAIKESEKALIKQQRAERLEREEKNKAEQQQQRILSQQKDFYAKKEQERIDREREKEEQLERERQIEREKEKEKERERERVLKREESERYREKDRRDRYDSDKYDRNEKDRNRKYDEYDRNEKEDDRNKSKNRSIANSKDNVVKLRDSNDNEKDRVLKREESERYRERDKKYEKERTRKYDDEDYDRNDKDYDKDHRHKSIANSKDNVVKLRDSNDNRNGKKNEKDNRNDDKHKSKNRNSQNVYYHIYYGPRITSDHDRLVLSTHFANAISLLPITELIRACYLVCKEWRDFIPMINLSSYPVDYFTLRTLNLLMKYGNPIASMDYPLPIEPRVYNKLYPSSILHRIHKLTMTGKVYSSSKKSSKLKAQDGSIISFDGELEKLFPDKSSKIVVNRDLKKLYLNFTIRPQDREFVPTVIEITHRIPNLEELHLSSTDLLKLQLFEKTIDLTLLKKLKVFHIDQANPDLIAEAQFNLDLSRCTELESLRTVFVRRLFKEVLNFKKLKNLSLICLQRKGHPNFRALCPSLTSLHLEFDSPKPMDSDTEYCVDITKKYESFYSQFPNLTSLSLQTTMRIVDISCFTILQNLTNLEFTSYVQKGLTRVLKSLPYLTRLQVYLEAQETLVEVSTSNRLVYVKFLIDNATHLNFDVLKKMKKLKIVHFVGSISDTNNKKIHRSFSHYNVEEEWGEGLEYNLRLAKY